MFLIYDRGVPNLLMSKSNTLFIIPARSGSVRIPNKNIRKFLGEPLIAYAIKQAVESGINGRVIVDTDSPKIAEIARLYGAEVPFLRPKRLATNSSLVADAIIHLLDRLKKTEKYVPKYIIILQTTSPLRTIKDITQCWKLIKSTDATTVLTVCPTHPKLYYLDKAKNIILVNGSERQSSNVQFWRQAYILNGCAVYIVKTKALLKEKLIVTKKTKAIVCDKWRSIDLDTPEDWVMAELLYKNRESIEASIKKMRSR